MKPFFISSQFERWRILALSFGNGEEIGLSKLYSGFFFGHVKFDHCRYCKNFALVIKKLIFLVCMKKRKKRPLFICVIC